MQLVIDRLTKQYLNTIAVDRISLTLHKGIYGLLGANEMCIRDRWDANGISTGSVIRYKGSYWMAYTGQWNGPVGMVGLASSKDLHHWEKCSYNPVTSPDDHYYAMNGAGIRTFSHWRDPYLFTDGEYAYHLTCATRKGGRPDACGTAGLARSRDMEHWELLLSLIHI